MALKILLALAALMAVLAIVVALRPAEFSVSRSAQLGAPPAVVFTHVNELAKWDAWSPWAKLDPKCVTTFTGPASGVGAVMAWASDESQVGTGSMTITESRAGERIGMRLEFKKPFEGTNLTTFVFAPEGAAATRVTWTMSGRHNFVGKALTLVYDCDTMIGGMFDQGLTNLDKVVTVPAPAAK